MDICDPPWMAWVCGRHWAALDVGFDLFVMVHQLNNPTKSRELVSRPLSNLFYVAASRPAKITTVRMDMTLIDLAVCPVKPLRWIGNGGF